MKKYTLLLLCGLFITPFVSAKTCTATDAEAADLAGDSLTSWAAVNQNRIKFGHCDEGGIAEVNSEAVARLLVDHWDNVTDLNALIPKNPALKPYVLGHLDSTLDGKDLEQIQDRAAHACPAGLNALCADLKRAAGEAASE